MDNQIDLKGLWVRQSAVKAPDVAGLVAEAGKIKRKIRGRLVLTNVCLVGSIGWVAYVGLYYHFRFVTTTIGILLTMLAMMFYAVAANGLLMARLGADPEEDSAGFLRDLLVIRQRQERLHGILLHVYFVLLTAGVGLYIIEFLVHMRLVWAFLAAGATFGWIVFTWVYLRPRATKKQLGPLQDVIGRLQEVNRQIGE